MDEVLVQLLILAIISFAIIGFIIWIVINNEDKPKKPKKERHMPMTENLAKDGGFIRHFSYFERIGNSKSDYYDYLHGDDIVKKKNAYSTAGVFEAKFQPKKLIRPTGYRCPDCGNVLYNLKADGTRFYCTECKYEYEGHY